MKGGERVNIEYKTPGHWREKLETVIGMSKKEVLEKFANWQSDKKTCIRCKENEYKYKDFCDVHLICEEAENGLSNVKSNLLRKEPCRSSWSIQVYPFKITPKRLSMDKHRR